MQDDPLNDLFNAAGSSVMQMAPRREPPASYVPPTYTERCGKCGGTGYWRPGYKCFTCNGSGKRTFKSSPEQRARNAITATNRRERQADTNEREFVEANPEIGAWLRTNTTDSFARSLLEKVRKYGDLTTNQLAAAKRATERAANIPSLDEFRAAHPAEVAWLEAQVALQNNFATSLMSGLQRYGSLTQNQLAAVTRALEQAATETRQQAEAPAIDVSRMVAAFQAAANAGLRNPKLRIAEFTFKLAGQTARHPGSIYVMGQGAGNYLGRVTNGKLIVSRSCTQEQQEGILRCAIDPREAARLHGLRTGTCSCCGRTLTDPVSVANGIGPICESRFGW